MEQTSIPTIAIVGRPNVGKSALFNRICKKRIAIVDEAEGITRDRIYADTELFGRPFRIIDTGGIDPRSNAPFNEEVKRQAELAIEEADGIILVVDVQVGITTLDEELAKLLLRTKKPLTVAINKVDHRRLENDCYSFMHLGISELVGVSASHNYQIAELCERILDKIPEGTATVKKLGVQIAIVGRPNVGKSSLVNKLLDDERCVVSPIAGTTRDSIDVVVEVGETPYTLIDTAGIRKKNAEHEVVDKFAAIRTERAIDRSNVCLLILDSERGMTTRDKKIAHAIEEAGKACILLFNKWDLVKGFRMEHAIRDVEESVPFLRHCPKLFISATRGRNLDKIFPLIDEVYGAWRQRIPTGQLNKVVADAMQRCHPPMIRGKRLRIYYLSQVATSPPRILFFLNYSDLMSQSYQRYLYNQIRDHYPFTGSPLKIELRERKQKEDRHHGSTKSLCTTNNVDA